MKLDLKHFSCQEIHSFLFMDHCKFININQNLSLVTTRSFQIQKFTDNCSLIKVTNQFCTLRLSQF